MSLLGSMTRDLGLTKRVSLSDVRLNDLNFYDYQDSVVESLKKSILKDGQMENAIVYEDLYDTNNELDGCKYTLIGGHSRYLALCKLMEEGLGDGMINVSIIEKPINENQELSLIMSNNVQRKKSTEVRYHEIEIWGKIYDELEVKPAGTKRDWIGLQIGMSGRGVDKVINRVEHQGSQRRHNEQRQPTKQDIIRRLKTNKKSILKTITMLENAGCSNIQVRLQELINNIDELIEMI